MLYVIYARDHANTLDKRLAVRPEHLARLEQLNQEGRMFAAGPLPAVDAVNPGEAGFCGSLIVAEFDSLEAARAWADADPYKAAGVFASIEVTPFRQVFPE